MLSPPYLTQRPLSHSHTIVKRMVSLHNLMTTYPYTVSHACFRRYPEAALRREWLLPAWLPWSPPAPALRAASIDHPAGTSWSPTP